MSLLSPRLRCAINAAARAHRDQVRKGSGIPYVSHVYAVMFLLSQVTDDEDILIAGLLHDTLEDVPEKYTAVQMEADFGLRVRHLVEDLTKIEHPSWQVRADAYIEHLEFHAAEEAVLISTADKLHNLMSIMDDLEEIGEGLWERFNAEKEKQLWWYAEINRVSTVRLGKNRLNEQLEGCVEKLKKSA
ncbi:HD domain-containing protein [Corynebacterium glutamicum]|uniref:HD domain-containing protein n=1 Tax=Corynebacterium glutamicum TaxID=1718 RepID=UPI0009434B73|nr:HD domain-containing protein [Corynebacterium glutamicum]OKX84311.1 guanosine polyphosphate pyrophosphohydrolase [Corynebacterium glutamicum]